MTENPEQLNHKYDKSNWAKGEWDNEPDRVDFIHASYSCFILRNAHGNWCGYVGVPNGHPNYGKDRDEFDVHGGITYSDKCSPPICHIPKEGMPEDVWWLGFDTAHAYDFSPSRWLSSFTGDIYRNMEYTINETKSLAEQLKKLE